MVSKHLNQSITELQVTDGNFKLTPTHVSVVFLRFTEFSLHLGKISLLPNVSVKTQREGCISVIIKTGSEIVDTFLVGNNSQVLLTFIAKI